MVLCTPIQLNVSMSENHSLHSSSKVCMVYDAIHLLLVLLLFHKPHCIFRHARHGPLASNFNPICEEFDGAIACDIHVSVLGFRAVETAKAEWFSWHWYAYIYAEHRSPHPRQKPLCMTSIGSINRRRIPKRIGILDSDCLLPRTNVMYTQYRAKYLLVHGPVGFVPVKDDGGTYPISLRAGHFRHPRSSIEEDRRSLLLRSFDVTQNLFQRMVVDDGTHFSRLRPGLNLGCLFDHILQ
mmetsp:Transcript_26279/g.47732  ORF Transcript_26279/g.47732 Transcript_26279/m.47732 type:complete len:239 (-) Transcript_26279:329-1045(-)